MNPARRKRLVKNIALGLVVAPGHMLLRLLALFMEALGAVNASKRLREKAMEIPEGGEDDNDKR